MSAHRAIVFILSTANSCRSKMAEGFPKKDRGKKWDVHGAGMNPKEDVHPLAVKVMAEVGIDIAHQGPKSSKIYLGHHAIAHIVIVCDKAHSACPRIWPGAFTRTNMPIDDLAGSKGTEDPRTCARERKASRHLGLTSSHQ